MGKTLSCVLAMLLCAASLFASRHVPTVLAQTSAPASCSAAPVIAPMQGHYTGAWHSDGDYHFSVFSTDLELKLTIDGSLDATVDGQGNVTGTATGNVQAPIYDYGRHDISSGIGTISGQITGVVAAGGSLLLLAHPVIDMHWGTFGGGHAVERFITMPDYTFSTSTVDCVSASGTIAETGFPEQNVVADGQGQVTQAPGIGTGTGTWQLASDQSAAFTALSSQVDSFVASANALLDAPAPGPDAGTIQQQIIAPFVHLRDTIQKNPGVARCLLARLASWEATAIPKLYTLAVAAVQTSSLSAVRAAEGVLFGARTFNADCNLEDSAGSAVRAARNHLLDDAVQRHDWPAAALAEREMLLAGTSPNDVVARLSADITQSTTTNGDHASLLSTAQFAAVSGDPGDARALQHRLTGTASTERIPPLHGSGHKKKGKRKRKTAPKARPKPTPKPTARPTPSPAPAIKTLRQILQASTPVIDGSTDGAAVPTFTWKPINGAATYIVVVLDAAGAPAWSWSGTATSVRYGDTALPGTTDDASISWPDAIPSGYGWTALALSASGTVVGVRLPQSL